MNILISLIKDEHGATAIEYGLIALLIAVACIVSMTSLGQNVNNTFSHVAGNYTAAVR